MREVIVLKWPLFVVLLSLLLFHYEVLPSSAQMQGCRSWGEPF